MNKKVIIAHGWGGHPDEIWFPWLKKELESNGFEVIVPVLPNTDEPKIANWVPALASVIDSPDGNTYLIGHSMGCQTIVRYLENLPEETVLGGAIFVAGFFKRLTGTGDEGEEVKAITKHWLETPVDLLKAKKHLKKSVAIFSDDDHYVPIDNQEEFKEQLGSKIIIENNQAHFSGEMTKLPVVIDELLKISNN